MWIVVVIILIFIIYKLAEKDKQKPAGKSHKISGRSCFDCKHCSNALTSQARQKGYIYCKWDSEHYYPETGDSCIDFNK